MAMNIMVSGSLAYDRIMDFPGRFSEHILPEKIHVLNVSFTVNSLTENFGGTAGNIAYALAMLGEKPIILATIGQDYPRYFYHLAENDITTLGIRVVGEEYTAGAYITTDQADNQITGFNPGAMKQPTYCFFDFDRIDGENIAIVAPGNLEDMIEYPRIYKERGIEYIFDPGQSLPMWNAEDLISCIEGSRILISNDYELELIMSKTGLDKKALLERATSIITTLGEKGSRICTTEGEKDIPAIKARKVLDPTGAGDAYRAGLIKGLVQGKSIEECALMGSVVASFAVESLGTQVYSFTIEGFQERLNR